MEQFITKKQNNTQTLKSIVIYALAIFWAIFGKVYLSSAQQIQSDSILSVEEEVDSTLQTKHPFQFSFIYPVGTYGVNSGKLEFRSSINLISGVTGGIDGAEFSGFSSYTNGNLRGFQASGFSNVVKGEMAGTQMSGFANAVKEKSKGGQFSGFSNVAGADFDGLQATGFYNVVRGNVRGYQISGFGNLVTESLKGVQISGFANNTRNSVKGAQISGFMNSADSIQGAQIAGFVNVAVDTILGGQIAGFTNVGRNFSAGHQISGFANVATGTINSQISGFINVADTVEGVQISVINICDTLSRGIPIGLINIVRHGGFRALELEANESFYFNTSYKLGVDRFYSIFSAGVRPTKNTVIWNWGYGVGTNFIRKPGFSANVDFTAHHVNEGEWFTNRLNLLNKVKLNFAKNLGERTQLYGGPSLNVFVRQTLNSTGGNAPDPNISTVNIYSWIFGDVETQIYPGVSLGMRF